MKNGAMVMSEKPGGFVIPAKGSFELKPGGNHLMFMGSYPLELGAMTPLFFSFIEREMIQNLMESATGARMHHSYARVGGLKDDLPAGWIAETKQVMKKLRRFCDEIEDLLFGNEIFQSRLRGIGVIPASGWRHHLPISLAPPKTETLHRRSRSDFIRS